MEGGRRRLFWIAMQSRRRRKKVGGGRCGRRARRSRSSVRPMPIELADGAPVSGNRGNTAMAAIPRTSALENGNGVASAGRYTHQPDPRHGHDPTSGETDMRPYFPRTAIHGRRCRTACCAPPRRRPPLMRMIRASRPAYVIWRLANAAVRSALALMLWRPRSAFRKPRRCGAFAKWPLPPFCVSD